MAISVNAATVVPPVTTAASTNTNVNAKINEKFSDEIGGKQHYVLRVNIPDKGTFYRLQVGPFASGKEAEQYCFSLVSAGQGCILAHGK